MGTGVGRSLGVLVSQNMVIGVGAPIGSPAALEQESHARLCVSERPLVGKIPCESGDCMQGCRAESMGDLCQQKAQSQSKGDLFPEQSQAVAGQRNRNHRDLRVPLPSSDCWYCSKQKQGKPALF